MNKDNSNLAYGIVLSPGQVSFLSDNLQGTSRCATLLSLIQMATITTDDSDDKSSIRVGQVNASITKLADQWSVNPKTARKLVMHFNQENLIHTESGPLGSVHSIKCLAGWVKDGVTIPNPMFNSSDYSDTICRVLLPADVDHGGNIQKDEKSISGVLNNGQGGDPTIVSSSDSTSPLSSLIFEDVEQQEPDRELDKALEDEDEYEAIIAASRSNNYPYPFVPKSGGKKCNSKSEDQTPQMRNSLTNEYSGQDNNNLRSIGSETPS